MRHLTAVVSPRAVAVVASVLGACWALVACAKDAAEAGSGENDAGGSTAPDSWTFYDTSVPRNDAVAPPDPPPPPPEDSGPPPPPVCGARGAPCSLSGGNDCNFFAGVHCVAARPPADAGSPVDGGDGGDGGDAGDAGPPPPDGVCIGVFDFVTCTSGRCGGGGRCLLAADTCLDPQEAACVCADAGPGVCSP